jgi:hypothetical protein
VGPLPGYVEEAVKSAYHRYMTYLASFGPEEHHLRKKVETELGTKMIHLKMRCSGIGAEWGKVRFFQKLLVPKVQFMPIPASVVELMFIYPCTVGIMAHRSSCHSTYDDVSLFLFMSAVSTYGSHDIIWLN